MLFNWKIVWAGAVFIALSGCSESPQAKEAKYLEKGKKEFQRQNYSVAVLHFKNAVAARPMDPEPYYQLGLTHLASNDVNTAASYFRKASELNPKHAGAQLKLAALMSTSRSKEAVEEAQKRTLEVLAALPEDIDALNILAATELRLGKPESAEAHLEQAVRKSPSHLRSSVALAQTRLARKDAAGAEEALKNAAAQMPKAPEPKIYLGGFYASQGKAAEAEQQFRQAITLNPKHAPALLALAELQLRAGQTEAAEQTYKDVSALPDRQYKPLHGLFLFQSGKHEQALSEFQRLAAADPTDRNLRTQLVKAYLALNRVADAEKVLTDALKKNGSDTDALLQRSRIYLSSGKHVEAQNDLNRVLHHRKDSAEAHYLLSKISEARGDSTIRKQELGEVVRLDPSYLDARIELARVLLASGGAQASLQLLDQAPEPQKGTMAVIAARNWALLALGRTEEARRGIDQALSIGKPAEAFLQDAALKFGQKDYAGARASAERALAANPEETRALNVLVQTYAVQKQMPIGVQKVREHAARQPASAAIQQFLGHVLFANGDRVGARKAFEAAKALKPDLIRAELALAEIDSSEGKRDDARKRLSAVVTSHPSSIPGRLLLAQLDLAEGKTAAAMEQYRTAVKLDGKNVLALNGLAYLLADNRQPDEALKYAQQAKELAPENAAVDDTLGWTFYQKGLYSAAVAHLESADAREGTALRKYHLAMAYLKAGDQKRGRQVLEGAMKMNPNLPEAHAARQLFGNAPH